MSEIINYQRSAGRLPVPQPVEPISVRPAVPADFAFIDGLQKKHAKMVGWWPRKQIEANIQKGQVLIAESIEPLRHGDTEQEMGSERSGSESSPSEQLSPSVSQCLRGSIPLGYCIFTDKYLKREELGIVYHLNVLPLKQRGLIGATLIREVFNRAAWGCKLFCCWCAQDLEANYFWEAMGFQPIAFRTGSDRKRRIHIFWQRRIRQGDGGPDSGGTPWWFPSTTNGGAVRADRIVLPIPPGVKWSDPMPVVLPGVPGLEEQRKALISEKEKEARERKKSEPKRAPAKPQAARAQGRSRGGLWFGPSKEEQEAAKAEKARGSGAKHPRAKRVTKVDPKYVAQARELRDRYLEEVNAPGGEERLLSAARGKYEVGRMLQTGFTTETPPELRAQREVIDSERLLDAA